MRAFSFLSATSAADLAASAAVSTASRMLVREIISAREHLQKDNSKYRRTIFYKRKPLFFVSYLSKKLTSRSAAESETAWSGVAPAA
jgi:hypothetical protein